MNSVFEKNQEALKKNRKSLYEFLQKEISLFLESPRQLPGDKFRWNEKEGLESDLELMTPLASGRRGYHLQPALEEVKQILTSIDLSYPQLVFFFGMGMGHCPQHFYKHRPARTKAIVIVENDPQIFLRALASYDFEAMINDKSVFFLIEKTLEGSDASIRGILSAYTTTNRFLKIIPCPAAIELHTDFYEKLAQLILKHRDLTTISAGNSVEDQIIGLRNICENSKRLIENPGIAGLANIFKGQTIISIAAGPSAGEHWDEIRALRNRIPIVACDTLLSELNRQGVEADFVCAIERGQTVATFFENVAIPERTSLVGPALLHPDCFNFFDGHHIAYDPRSIPVDEFGLPFLGPLFPGSSAGNLNVAFAHYLGFSRIIMVGHDLSFGAKEARSHVSGTGIQSQDNILSEEELLKRSQGQKVLTQDGSMEVYTTSTWNLFRAQMEALIVEAVDTEVINTSAKGAAIKGTTLMSLKEALQKSEGKSSDIWKEKKHRLPQPSGRELDDRVQHYKKRSEEILERMEYWDAKIEPLTKKLDDWKAKIEEKELRGKPVSLAFLDDALNEVLRVKVAAVNKDFILQTSFIRVIHPYHLAFERELNKMPGTYKDNYLLKKDFLLKHIAYFSIWRQAIPHVRSAIESGLANLSQ